MKTIHTKAKFTKWLSADDMHFASKTWLSELQFYKDEQIFLEDLITDYTLQLIDKSHFNESKAIVAQLTKIVDETKVLLSAVTKHEKSLSVMIDDVDQIDLEKKYKEEHRNLTELLGEFKNRYQIIKKRLFKLLQEVMKQDKQKRLLT